MKKLVIGTLLLFSLLAQFIQPAQAQTPVEVENMQIDVWPEYDRRDALVIYRFTLTAQTTLPAQFSLRIPREAVQPYNVAYKDVDNKLYNMQFNTAVEGDWLRITVTSPSPEIQFEYYDPRLARTGTRRQLEYKWPGDLKVRNMTFRVQQPLNASGMKITPQQGSPSADGSLTYYTVNIGAVENGTSFNFQMSYEKADETLSAASQPVKAADSSTTPSGASGIAGELNTVIIGFALGVVFIAVGLFWYFRTQRREPVPAGRRRHSNATTAQQRNHADSGKSVFCHQCGKRSNPGDTFCRACGTKLRLE